MKVVTIILGVLLALGGLYCMFTPIATYSTIAWLIGIAMIVEGVGSIITWNDRRKLGQASGLMLAEAIISIVLGVFLLGSFVLQFSVDLFIAYFIAIWLVIAGIARIVAAVNARNSQDQQTASGWVGHIVLGVLIILLGILCIINPLSVMAGVGMMLGISIVVVGVDLVFLGLEM
ncbi:MAG: DUF308 domain-containing protein [Eggerthellaceae bacterium]|nr:DUF308 domain-containing protein [Eggerthellaceae bacterium]